MKRNFYILAIFLGLVATAYPVRAQVVGPIEPPPKFEVKRIPAKPNPGAPPLPASEIIHRFTQNEDSIRKAYETKSFRQTIHIEELVQGGGEFAFVGQSYTKADGKRYERVIEAPDSTLKYTEFSIDDVKTVTGIPLFFLTANQLPHYTLTYEGKQKLDEINTFIFRVKPKTLGNRPLFDGIIWIDDQDFAIVKSSGRFLTVKGNFYAGFPFDMFDVYSQNLEGRMWFPMYIRSDAQIKTPSGDVPLRLVVRSTDFKTEIPASTRSSTAKSPATGGKTAGPHGIPGRKIP